MSDTISYFFKFSTVLAAGHDAIVGPYLVPGNPANFYNPIDVYNLSVSSVNVTSGFWCLVYTSDDLSAHPALQFAVDEFIQTGSGGKIIVNNLVWPVTINNLQILSQGRINHYVVAVPETNAIQPPPPPVPPPVPVTLTDLVGYVPANFNFLPWSLNLGASNFADPQWSLHSASITTGVPGPTHVANAAKLVETAVGGMHHINSDNSPQTNAVTPIHYRIAVIAQAAGRTRIVVEWDNFEDANSSVTIGFDLTGGNVGYDNIVGSNSTLIATAMTSIGGGWWLCTFDAQYNGVTVPTSLVWQPKIFLDNGSGTTPRSISYGGDGVSGVNLWWFNILPVTAWHLTNLAFHDDFDSLATIDLTNSKAPGFNWYVNNRFPSSFMTTFGWTTNPPSAPTPPGNLSISSPSVLKIFNPNNNQTGFTSQLFSVVDNGAGGLNGHSFSPPMVFDGLFNWDGTSAGFSPNWAGNPAFWGSTTDALIGTPTSGRFLEWDVVEGGPSGTPTSGSSTKHEWSGGGTPVNFQTGSAPVLMNMVTGTFQRISGMWLKIETGGWGIFLTFINGQFLGFSDVAYSATTLPQPTGANAVVGTFSEADNQMLPVFMDTAENVTNNPGGGWPMFIDWVKVYTT